MSKQRVIRGVGLFVLKYLLALNLDRSSCLGFRFFVLRNVCRNELLCCTRQAVRMWA